MISREINLEMARKPPLWKLVHTRTHKEQYAELICVYDLLVLDNLSEELIPG